MYFSAIKNSVQHLEEKMFYQVALLYLSASGYQDLSIVDGTGDGGRDVTCSRNDLRIQLSVRKDWENKVNEEAEKTLSSGKRHFIYITNKIISPTAESEFFDSKYRFKGEVDVSIIDLRRLSTTLARPTVINSSYEMLGMKISPEIHATPKEIAVSSVIMFSREAKELRNEIIEANVRAHLLANNSHSEAEICDALARSLPGTNVTREARAAISRLRAEKRVVGSSKSLKLSEDERQTMLAAETELLTAKSIDVEMISEKIGISKEDSIELLDIALELMVRERSFDGSGPAEESLRNFLASRKLTRRRMEVFEVLSSTSTARLRQHGETLDLMMSADTFDIYRALGRRTTITLVMDSSVAMPVIFGLSFGTARSRYGVAALALKRACEAHGIKMVVPSVYLSEIAAHGLRALETIDVYEALPSEARSILRDSGNAYLSHFSHIVESTKDESGTLKLKDFLEFFGVRRGSSRLYVENRLTTLFDQHGIRIIAAVKKDQTIKSRIVQEKPKEPSIIIENDAVVATTLKNNDENGYILATWDRVMVDIVQELARVYADRPSRVIDFLSIAGNQDFETEESFDMLTTLLHVDSRQSARLASMIDNIKTIDTAYKLDSIVRSARTDERSDWELTPEIVAPLIDEEKNSGATANQS